MCYPKPRRQAWYPPKRSQWHRAQASSKSEAEPRLRCREERGTSNLLLNKSRGLQKPSAECKEFGFVAFFSSTASEERVLAPCQFPDPRDQPDESRGRNTILSFFPPSLEPPRNIRRRLSRLFLPGVVGRKNQWANGLARPKCCFSVSRGRDPPIHRNASVGGRRIARALLLWGGRGASRQNCRLVGWEREKLKKNFRFEKWISLSPPEKKIRATSCSIGSIVAKTRVSSVRQTVHFNSTELNLPLCVLVPLSSRQLSHRHRFVRGKVFSIFLKIPQNFKSIPLVC